MKPTRKYLHSHNLVVSIDTVLEDRGVLVSEISSKAIKQLAPGRLVTTHVWAAD